jgi:uncharacterized protein YhfF/GNAT superfamily N-acetyltransferase
VGARHGDLPAAPAMMLDALDNSVAKDARVHDFWRAFCRGAHVPESTPYQAWYFGDSPALAHDLAELVLHGPKRATAGLAVTLDAMPHVAPEIDGYSVVTEYDGTPRALIRTTDVQRRPFRQVDADFAWTEGEGDRTLEDWRAGHWSYFTRECAALGRTMSESELVVLERFELLYPFEQARNPVACGPRIVPALLPGGLDDSARLQLDYYSRQHGFTSAFERDRLHDIAEFGAAYDASRDGVWLLVNGGEVLGSAVIDARADVPELRWFIVADALRGHGWGERLMQCVMQHCMRRHPRVRLLTFSALAKARRLYEAFGFVRVGDGTHFDGWGPTIVDQQWEWTRI